MTTDGTLLGDRMKQYEAAAATVLPRRTYTIIRVDIRAAHTLLRRAERPFDAAFMSVMDAVALDLCRDLSGSVFAYVQSDEISVLLTDFENVGTQAWLGGVVQKQASIAAAAATAAFAEHAFTAELGKGLALAGRCMFDGRTFTIPADVEVANYFVWRQRDWMRNSVTMAAMTHFSHSRLMGLNSDQRQELLFREAGVNWNDYSDACKRGRVCVRRRALAALTSGDAPVVRHVWAAEAAERFQAVPGGWLASVIPPLPSLAGGS